MTVRELIFLFGPYDLAFWIGFCAGALFVVLIAVVTP